MSCKLCNSKYSKSEWDPTEFLGEPAAGRKIEDSDSDVGTLAEKSSRPSRQKWRCSLLLDLAVGKGWSCGRVSEHKGLGLGSLSGASLLRHWDSSGWLDMWFAP